MAEYSKESEDDQIDPLKLLEIQFEEAECLTPFLDDSFEESENILSVSIISTKFDPLHID